MTQNDFAALCGERLIAPEIALENEDLQTALAERNDERVKQILDEEF